MWTTFKKTNNFSQSGSCLMSRQSHLKGNKVPLECFHFSFFSRLCHFQHVDPAALSASRRESVTKR